MNNNRFNEALVEGKVYLVQCYSKRNQWGEYSLCIYKDGCWIPYSIWNIVKNDPTFKGVPVTVDEFWVCVDNIFNNIDNHNEEREKHNNEEQVEEQIGCVEYSYLMNFINELRNRIVTLEKRMDNIPITLPYPPASPNTPLQPGYPYVPACPPSIPEWPQWPPYGPIISYSFHSGSNTSSTIIDPIK